MSASGPSGPLVLLLLDCLTLKAPRKDAFENVVCCKLLPKITDKLSIEANSVDPEQTAPMGPHCFP